MSSNEKPEEVPSTTSSILHKQDAFWENIIGAYENAIHELKTEEIQMQNYVFELKILIQAIAAFNIIKLLNQNGDAALISQLLRLKCICPKSIKREEPITIATAGFDISSKDIAEMAKIKDLVNRERVLIDEVNILRIKDITLTEMKLSVDHLMKMNFPNMVFSTGQGTISDIPEQIVDSMKQVRQLSTKMRELQTENNKTKNCLHEALPNEFLRLRRKNHQIEDRTIQMTRQLTDMLSSQNADAMNDILEKSRSSYRQLTKLVNAKRAEVNLLRFTIESLKQLK